MRISLSVLTPITTRNPARLETARSFHCITHWHPAVDLYQRCRAFAVLRQEDHPLSESVATENARARLSSKAFPLTTTVIGSPAFSVTSRVTVARMIPTLRCRPRHCSPKRRLCHAAGTCGSRAEWSACSDRPAKPSATIRPLPLQGVFQTTSYSIRPDPARHARVKAPCPTLQGPR